MKKFAKMLGMVFTLCLITLGFVGCGENKTTSIEVKENTLKTSFYIGQTVDFSNTIIIANKEDGSKVEVEAEDCEFSTITTTEVGKQTLTITYDECTTTAQIRIVELNANYTSMIAPKFVSDYISSKSVATGNDAFINREETFKVGVSNEFVFLPRVFYTDGISSELDTLDSVKTTTKVYAYNTTEEEFEAEPMDATTLATYVTINNNTNTYQFTQAAIGKQFKIEVTMDDEFAQKTFINTIANLPTVSFEFECVDAYNIYNAKQLSVIDNVQQANADFRAANGIADANIKGIVLMNNIDITSSDISDVFLYNDGDSDFLSTHSDYAAVKGSMRDNESIFSREVASGETFTMNGNYFTIDASTMPYILRKSGDNGGVPHLYNPEETLISHTCLFDIRGISTLDGEPQGYVQPKVDVKNFAFKGNSNRSEDVQKSGGLILFESGRAEATVSNNIATAWFIAYFPDAEVSEVSDTEAKIQDNKFTIDSCKVFDSFNSAVYVWGSSDVLVKNSELVGAGGPLFIVDHVRPEHKNITTTDDENDYGLPSNVTVVNSKLESYVTGQEGWFQTFKGATTLAGAIIGLGDICFTNNATATKTFVKYEQKDNETIKKINLICVMKSSEQEDLTFTKISGSFKAKNSEEDTVNVRALDFDELYENNLLYSNTYLFNSGVTTGAQLFVTSAGGFGIADPGQDASGTQVRAPSVTDITSNVSIDNGQLYQGDYMNVYVSMPGSTGYMGVVLGYFDKETIQD